jgi:hypothetical protein
MPGKTDFRRGGSFDVLDDGVLQYIVGHMKWPAIGIEVFLLQVVAVLAVQVADGSGGFDENLKLTGSLDHEGDCIRSWTHAISG